MILKSLKYIRPPVRLVNILKDRSIGTGINIAEIYYLIGLFSWSE
jgi:hypothetical protein